MIGSIRKINNKKKKGKQMSSQLIFFGYFFHKQNDYKVVPATSLLQNFPNICFGKYNEKVSQVVNDDNCSPICLLFQNSILRNPI